MTSIEDMASQVTGSLRSVDGTGVVRIESRYAAPIREVWSALTEPARLAGWAGTISGDLRPGGEFHCSLTSGWEGVSRVEACEPPVRLLLTMDLDNPDEIEVTLTADSDRTGVIIEQRMVPLDELAEFGAGMQVHAEDLGAHLTGRDRCDIKIRWNEVISTYRDLAAKIA